MKILGMGQAVWSQPMALMPMWFTPRLDFEDQLEALMDQHKDLWEFHVSHSKPCFPSVCTSVKALVVLLSLSSLPGIQALVTTFEPLSVFTIDLFHSSRLPSCVHSLVRRNHDETKVE